MHIPEKKLIIRLEKELKKQAPFLGRWKSDYARKANGCVADIVLTAFFKGEPYHFCVEVKRAGYPKYVREAAVNLREFVKHNPGYYPIVAVPVISERARRICDEYDTGYMDFTGTIKIASGGIFIQKEGRKEDGFGRAENQSIFSPKASRITKLFLSRPGAKWMQKDIVKDTGLSKGMVSRVVNRMSRMGYIAEKGNALALSNFDDLLSSWVEEVLRRRENKRSYYVWARNPEELMRRVSGELAKKGIKYAFTQEAGASLVAPFSSFDIVSMYIESFDAFPADNLSAEETKKGFNLTVIEASDEAILASARDIQSLKVVDNLQLYADLKRNPLRGDKQAEHVLNIIKKKAV